MKKAIKTLLIVILVIGILFIVAILSNTGKKYIIIKKLQERYSESVSTTNYYVKFTRTESYNCYTTLEYYRKDEKAVLKTTIIDEENNIDETITWYAKGDGNYDKFFVSADGTKEISQYYSEEEEEFLTGESVYLYNYLESDSDLKTFIEAMTAKVEKVEYEEDECYYIENFQGTETMSIGENQGVYINSETGLPMCVEYNYTIKIDETTYEEVAGEEYEYEFDNVDDEIFVEPDISEYTLVEDE